MPKKLLTSFLGLNNSWYYYNYNGTLKNAKMNECENDLQNEKTNIVIFKTVRFNCYEIFKHLSFVSFYHC